MNRQVIGSLALALAVGLASPAAAGTMFGFQIGISGAPAPPRVVYAARPRMALAPEAGVYVAEVPGMASDEFNVGPYWYLCSGDYWYRSTSFGGPFFAVDVRMVPSRIFAVAPARWHAYPERLARWRGDNDHTWDRDRDRGRDQDGRRGNGWGSGRDQVRDDSRGRDRDRG